MVTFISSALFALSASLDAFPAGVSLGLYKIHISLRHNLLISLVALTGTILSLCLGRRLMPLLPGHTASMAGSLLLVLMGSYYLIKFMLQTIKKYLFPIRKEKTGVKKRNHSSRAPLTPPSGFRSILTFGLALSLNNIGIGISASIAGLSPLPSAALTFLFSFLLLALGNRLGQAKILRSLEYFAEPVTGIMLILLSLI